MNKSLVPGCVAEFIGAFALMFVGGAAIINTAGGGGLLIVALAHGLILCVTVTAAMHISGGQFNPAVSIALALIRKQPWDRAIAFCIAQLAGAVAGAGLLAMTFGSILSGDLATLTGVEPSATSVVKMTATLGPLAIGETANIGVLLALEAVATFLLMITILGTAVDPRGTGRTMAVGGFGIGLCVTANILAIGPQTGASMNPCRSFGPALIGGVWEAHWAYWVAPIAGACLAAVLWKAVMERPPEPEPARRA